MNQTNTQPLARQSGMTQHASSTASTAGGAGSFTLVLLMPISFVLTMLTIVMLQH